MENEIESNLVYLANHLTNLDSVLLHLLQTKILSKNEREEILNEGTSFKQNTSLLMIVLKKDWDVIRNPFLEILRLTHNEHCVSKIEENSPKVQPVINWTYETNTILGYGSFSVVISVRDKLDEQHCALKLIPNQDVNSSCSEENVKLLRESRNQAILQHPNVVKYISSDTFSLSTEKIKEILLWESGGASLLGKTNIQTILKACFGEAKYHGNRVDGLFIKTEICGETLRQWLNNHVRNEAIPELKLCENVSQGIVDGLNYIHSKSIIHRDLRPENIFFSKPNSSLPVKIGDFGLSNQIENYSTQTMTLEVGNHLYRAPETNLKHKTDSAKYSHAIDLYSCGLTLSEIFDPAPASELQTKFITVVYMRDTGNRIKELIPWLNKLILKLTDREPTNRFNRDANGKPLPIEFLKVSPEKDNVNVPQGTLDTLHRENESLQTLEHPELLPQKDISQSLEDSEQKDKSDQSLNLKGESNSEVIFQLQEDFSKVKEELRQLVEEKNISEIIRILSVTPIPKYQLDGNDDEVDLTFEGEVKKMYLEYCSLNLDSFERISTEELELWEISLLRNGKELQEVTVNEFVDIHKMKKLILWCESKNNLSLDLSDESVSLKYLCLESVNVLNWKEAKWSVDELRLEGLAFTENTQLKVKDMKLFKSLLVDISCLPQTLEKLALCSPKEVRCTERIELPNLKNLELYQTSNKNLSHFSSVNFTHLDLRWTTGELNVNFIPKSVTHIKIEEPHPLVVGGVLKLEKLILNDYSANKVEECLTHFQPKELVVKYDPECPSKELLELLKKGIQRIAVYNVDCYSILSKHVISESDYYLFEGEKGKAITKEEFDKLLKFTL